MSRRGLSLALLVVIAVQLIGATAFAADCLEPCPDDADGRSCPPVCTLCTSCTHAQQAIVGCGEATAPLMAMQELIVQPPASMSSQLAADIFHVPLLG